MITTTSGNSFDKTLTNSYNLYTSIKNDTVVINYGDSSQQIIQLNAALIQSYNIPSSIPSLTTNGNSSFLLLNNEFRNATFLSGFQLYGAVNGSITIEVIYFNYLIDDFKFKILILMFIRLCHQIIVDL